MDKKDLLYSRPADFIREPFCEVTHDDIKRLVDSFYDRIRAHEVLGSVFNDIIGDNWDVHLKKMYAFWASVILKTSEYSGRPMPAHVVQHSIKVEHFPIWMELFKETANDILTEEAAYVFIDRAERIALSLTNGIKAHRA